MTRVVQRAFRYRFYPTHAQAEQLNRTFGCVRLVYNKALNARTSAWSTHRRTITYGQTSAMLTEWKRHPDHARIADRRRDLLHKLSTRLVRDNQTVVIEDLAVRNMLANHRLARAISDAAWAQLRGMLEYKAAWYGRRLVVVDRWLPSSKQCSTCGRLAASMPLGLREWTCPCGARHDRDVNAARNILAAGLVER